jgi:hypothetical protein
MNCGSMNSAMQMLLSLVAGALYAELASTPRDT